MHLREVQSGLLRAIEGHCEPPGLDGLLLFTNLQRSLRPIDHTSEFSSQQVLAFVVFCRPPRIEDRFPGSDVAELGIFYLFITSSGAVVLSIFEH